MFDDLPLHVIQSFLGFFRDVLQSTSGTLGFTKSILADADDTSRVVLAQAVLHSSHDVQPLLELFFAGTHFRSYELEGSPSFTVNCNVLIALLECSAAYQEVEVIEQTLHFLLAAWDSGAIVDKWNLGRSYSLMLFSDCLLKLLQRLEAGGITLEVPTFAKERLIAVIWQILSQVLESQLSDGSWGQSLECTAYSIIAISQCLQLPWSSDLRSALLVAVSAGQKLISNGERDNYRTNDHVWVEKVSYGSALLRKSYLISALHATQVQESWSSDTSRLFSIVNAPETRKMSKLLAKTPQLQANPLSTFDLVLLESSHYAARLRAERNIIFAEAELPEAHDKYVDFIPVFWVACNSIRGHPLPPSTIWQMCLLSQLVYHSDAYMEGAVSQASAHVIERVKARLTPVRQATTPFSKRKRALKDEREEAWATSCRNDDAESLERICNVLESFTNWVLQHSSVVRSPPNVRKQLAEELHDFFLAHLSHIMDNRVLCTVRECSEGGNDNLPSSLDATYVKWVTTTGANDTSCPFASLFFSCLISEPGTNCFSTSPQITYLFQALTRHLAIMCRQYNDYGSVERDAEENNLNSLDFPEFGGPQAGFTSGASGTASKSKADLMDIANFERRCMGVALQRLDQLLGAGNGSMAKLRVYVDVTDLWGQVYVLKDLTGRLAKQVV